MIEGMNDSVGRLDVLRADLCKVVDDSGWWYELLLNTQTLTSTVESIWLFEDSLDSAEVVKSVNIQLLTNSVVHDNSLDETLQTSLAFVVFLCHIDLVSDRIEFAKDVGDWIFPDIGIDVNILTFVFVVRNRIVGWNKKSEVFLVFDVSNCGW